MSVFDVFDPMVTPEQKDKVKDEYSKHVAEANQRDQKTLADMMRCTDCGGTEYYPTPKGDKRCPCLDDSLGVHF